MPRPLTPRFSPRFALFALFAVELLTLPGCLQRRIQVLTDPPGATVWLNDTEIGRSPTETAFTFFGRYDVRVAKDGYETLLTTKDAIAPWYEYPFVDLFVVALPFNVDTKLQWHFTLRPLTPLVNPPGEKDLLERANALRHDLGADKLPEMGPPEPKRP